MAVDIQLGERISAGVPRPFFSHTRDVVSIWRPVTGFSHNGEGERFLRANLDSHDIQKQRPKPI